MKRRLSVILALVLIASLCLLYLPSCTRRVIEYQFGDYRYTVENQEVTITEYSGDATDVTVPESIDGMPVVAIGRSAFHNCDKMKSLTLPDSVIKIGGLAFNKCYSLEHVTLGRGIREIDYSPFANCEKMIYNEYENGLYVGNDENPYFALVSMTSNNKKIEIHPDAIVVCGSALEYCRSLCELVFPEGVVSIGSFAMQSCLSLETVYIPKSVESIGLLAFQNCDSIQKIVVSDENPHFKSVDGSLFSRDGSRLIKYATGQNVISYRIPDSTVIIEDFAFANAKHLTEVILPDSVEKIGHSAFIHCENMQSIHLGNALKKIGGQAFGYCTSLTEITIPDSVEELSYCAFSYCDKLESAVIGSGVVSLEFEVFHDCDALKEVIFRDPKGWKVSHSYSIRSYKVDLSDPKKNADYLTNEYCDYYWYKK